MNEIIATYLITNSDSKGTGLLNQYEYINPLLVNDIHEREVEIGIDNRKYSSESIPTSKDAFVKIARIFNVLDKRPNYSIHNEANVIKFLATQLYEIGGFKDYLEKYYGNSYNKENILQAYELYLEHTLEKNNSNAAGQGGRIRKLSLNHLNKNNKISRRIGMRINNKKLTTRNIVKTTRRNNNKKLTRNNNKKIYKHISKLSQHKNKKTSRYN